MVTNGSKFSYNNNQPLQTKNIIGVHNGIFTNLNNYDDEKTINFESYSVKSDSLTFFENISNLSEDQNFLFSYQKYMQEIVGNYSIAFTFKNENKILISSNCGSLYYYHDNDFFCFSSEKKILFEYLKQSKISKRQINFKNIIKCINSTIIFNKDENQLLEINHEEKSIDEKLKFDNNSTLNVSIT